MNDDKPRATPRQVADNYILQTLAEFGGRKDKTAAAIGISLKTLYNVIKRNPKTTTAKVAASPVNH